MVSDSIAATQTPHKASPFEGDNNPLAKPEAIEAATRAISAPSKIPSLDDLGNSWKAAANASPSDQAGQFGKLNADIAMRAAGMIEKGGAQSIPELETQLNKRLKGVPGGPMLDYDEAAKKLTILHLRPATDAENLDISTRLATGRVTEDELSKQGIRTAKSTEGETSLFVPIVKPETIDLFSKPGKSAEQARTSDMTAKPNDAPAWGDKVPGAGTLPPSPYVMAALTEALKTDIKMDPNWRPINAAQKELLNQSASLGPEVDALKRMGLLDGVAQAGGVDKVNEMFAKHKIPIKLDDVGKDGVAAGGVFDFKAKWEGKEAKLQAKDADGTEKTFDAFEKGVKSYKVDGTTVLEVYRDNEKGITMYMAPSEADLKGYAAYNKAFELTPGQNTARDEFTKALLPKMKVRDEGDVPQMIGLGAAGGLRVTQAKVFTSADFDQSGAEVKQGMGVGMTRSIVMQAPDKVFKMDKPPLVWIVQDGASKPLIAFRVGQDSWKDPKKP